MDGGMGIHSGAPAPLTELGQSAEHGRDGAVPPVKALQALPGERGRPGGDRDPREPPGRGSPGPAGAPGPGQGQGRARHVMTTDSPKGIDTLLLLLLLFNTTPYKTEAAAAILIEGT